MPNRTPLTLLAYDGLVFFVRSDGAKILMSVTDGELQLDKEFEPIQALALANELAKYALELLLKDKK